MSETRLARYLADFFASGEIKYAAGQHYPLSEEVERHIAQGIAEEIKVDLTAEKAQKLAEKARLAADKAAAAAATAQALAEAAQEAEILAADAAAALSVAQDEQAGGVQTSAHAVGGELVGTVPMAETDRVEQQAIVDPDRVMSRAEVLAVSADDGQAVDAPVPAVE